MKRINTAQNEALGSKPPVFKGHAMSTDDFSIDEHMNMELEMEMESELQPPSDGDPISRILDAADRGAFFRTPIKAIFYVGGVLFLLGCIAIAFSLISFPKDYSDRPDYCDRLDEICTSSWDCPQKDMCNEYKRSASTHSNPWFTVLGLFVFGVAGLRVLFVRGRQVSTKKIPRFHVTPVLLHAIKTNGDIAFFGFVILGITSGFDALLFDAELRHTPVQAFAGFEEGGIIAGPLCGFLVMLVHHAAVEFASAFIATAESAVKIESNTKALTFK